MIEENEISYDDNEISKIKTDDVTRKQHNDVTRIKPQDVTRTQTDVMVQFQPDNAKPLQPDNVKPVQPDDVTRITDFANVKFSGLPRRRNRPTQEANSKPDKVKNSDEILISNSPLKIKPELLTATPYNQKIVKDEVKHLTKVTTMPQQPQQQQPQSVTYSNNNNPFQSFFSNFYADKIRSSPRALTYEPAGPYTIRANFEGPLFPMHATSSYRQTTQQSQANVRSNGFVYQTQPTYQAPKVPYYYVPRSYLMF